MWRFDELTSVEGRFDPCNQLMEPWRTRIRSDFTQLAGRIACVGKANGKAQKRIAIISRASKKKPFIYCLTLSCQIYSLVFQQSNFRRHLSYFKFSLVLKQVLYYLNQLQLEFHEKPNIINLTNCWTCLIYFQEDIMPLYLLDKTVEGLQIPKPIMVCTFGRSFSSRLP